MHRILVATDGSDGANRAVDTAADFANRLQLELWIVSAMDGVSEEALEFAKEERVAIGDALNDATSRILAEAKQRSQRLGAQAIHVRSVWGDAAEKVLELSREIEADAIFIGRRGRGRLQGLLLGSVSQKLASLAPCMTAIVP